MRPIHGTDVTLEKQRQNRKEPASLLVVLVVPRVGVMPNVCMMPIPMYFNTSVFTGVVCFPLAKYSPQILTA